MNYKKRTHYKQSHKNKFVVILLFIFTSTSLFAQKITLVDDDFKLKVKTAKLIEGYTIATNVRVNTEVFNILKVKVRVISKSGKREYFDLNSFSTVDFDQKYRVRSSDANYHELNATFGFPMLVKDRPDYSIFQTAYEYKPSVRDSYVDYSFNDVENIEMPMQFGTQRKSDKHIVYYDRTKIRSKVVILFFPVLKSSKNMKVFYKKMLLYEHSV